MSDSTRSARERARIEALRRYDARVAGYPFAVESRQVETSAGDLHLLITGAVDAPPLMIFHGASESAIDSIDYFGSALLDGFRCHWVDQPGEAGRSETRRPKLGDNGYARWIVDTLDALELQRVGMMGLSLGGFATLQTCAYAPERVSAAVFVVPAGFTRPKLSMGWDLVVATLRMTLRPSLANTRRFADAMTGPGVELSEEQIERIHLNAQAWKKGYRGRPGDFVVPAEALAAYQGPALVIVGQYDPMFDGEATIAAARKGLSGLRDAISLPGEGHIFSADGFAFAAAGAAELFEASVR